MTKFSASRYQEWLLCPSMIKYKLSREEHDYQRHTAPAHIYGVLIHDHIGKYLLGETEYLDVGVGRYYALVQELKHSLGILHIEERWLFDRHWQLQDEAIDPTKPEIVVVLDACVIYEDIAHVIDFKTGKGGYGFKHEIQGQIYARGVLAKYPHLKEILVEFWYLDKPLNHKRSDLYSRAEILAFNIPVDKFLDGLSQRKPGPESLCKKCRFQAVCEDAIGGEEVLYFVEE